MITTIRFVSACLSYTDPESSGKGWIIILAAVGGTILLILLVSVVFVGVCQRRVRMIKRPVQVDNMPQETAFPYPDKYELAETKKETTKSTEKLVAFGHA